MNLINRKNLIVAVAFGLIAFLIIYFEIFYSIPGTILLSDPREVIVTLGAALTGPIGGIIVGFLSSIYDPKSEIILYVLAQHIFGAFLFAIFYKKIIYENFRMPFFLIFWSLLIFCYYFIFYIPVFSITYFFDRAFYETILPGNYSFLDALIILYKGWIPEFIFTTLFTSLVLIALPERFRKPLWGKDTKSAQMKLSAEKKVFYDSNLFKNILPIRLILWFLILAIIPIYIIGFSIKKDLVKSLLDHEAIFRQSMANGYKQKFIELTPLESINFFKEAQKALSGDLFIMSKTGNYALVAEKEKENKDVRLDYSKSVVEKILTMKNGNYIDEEIGISFGFASFKTSMHELIIVAVSNKDVVSNIAAELKNEIHRKLLFGFIIVSLSLIIIIWFIVKTPLAKFRDVILQFSDGIYNARVPLDEMNDEIKLLASSFNNMADRISTAKENLEEEIIVRKETEKQLLVSEKRWKFALEGAGDGLWDWNAQTNQVYYSNRWKSMLGYEENEISDSLDEWSSRIHPDDKEKCLDDIGRYLKGETHTYQNEHRMRCKDGSYKWILDRGKIIEWTDDGKPFRVIGTHNDIDFQKKTIVELERKNVFIQTVLDNLPIGLAINEFDSGRASYINKKFREIYGWTEEIIADIPSFFEHVYPDEEFRQEMASRIMADIQSGDPVRMRWENIKITTEKGEERYVSAVNIPIIEQNIMVSTVRDVTEQFIAQQKVLKHNKSLNILLETSRQVASTLELDIVLQNIIDSIINLIDLDSGAIYLINGSELYLAASNPPLPPDIPEVFRHALLKNHLIISSCIREKEPINILDIETVDLTPEEKLIVETKNFKSLLYLPLISGEEIHAVLIIGTVGRKRFLSDSEIEICKTFSNISALAINNAKLYKKSQQNIINLEKEIQERARIEKELRASEDKFQKAFQINPDAIIISRLSDGVFLEVNDGFRKLTGYSYEDVVGKSSYDIHIWKNPEDRKKLSDELKLKGWIDNFETEYCLKDGSICIGLMSAGVIELDSEKCILSITRDITESKQAEIKLMENQRKLAETNQLLQSVLDTVPSRIFWKDKNLTYLGCNKPFANDAGHSSPEELIGLNDYDITWKEQAELYRSDDMGIISSGKPKLDYEEPQTTPDGKQIWLRTSKVPLRDVNQKIIGVLGSYEDITAKKVAEVALQESEERYKSLFNNNHSVMLLIETESGKIVDANPAACNYYGWSREEILNKKITEINILSSDEVLQEMELARTQKRNRFFFKHRLANGEIRDVEVFSGSVIIRSKNLLYSIIHDITDRIIVEKALKNSEDRLNQAVRVSLIGIYDHDHINNILYYSPHQRMIFGLDLEEEVTMQKYIETVHPDDRAMIGEAVKKAHDPKGDGLFDVEFRILKKDGSVRWISTRSQTYFTGKDDNDFPLRTIGAVIDITERKQFEKQLTDALKEKEILIREVHHRVKNNFQVIVSLLSLQSDLITDPVILNAFKESRNRIKSMALIHELLYQESNFESIDIKHYVQNLVDYLRRSYADTKSNFDISIDMEDIQIEIDTIIPCGLIINELISNSIKHAFPDGRDGEIHISFKKISMESYCLILRDNGIGIPKNIDRRNHKSLGMMLINTLTKQINGELYIESSDKGSEFRIIFKAKN